MVTLPPSSLALGLLAPGITFWSARDGGLLLGCGALRELDASHGEIKSMHVAIGQRGRGVGAAILRHILDVARGRGYRRVSLETDSWRRSFRRAGSTRGSGSGPVRLSAPIGWIR
jgi:N-acetylglutamate synthase-like GNAT family acetyltransferase